MIKNERQYSITKKWIAKFRKAIADFNVREATKKIGSSVLAKAELEALKSELLTLIEQVKVYENQKIAARTEEARKMVTRFRKWKYQKLDKRPKVIRILKNIKKNLKSLKKLKYAAEDEMYRFYHHSFKVYCLQSSTLKIVKKIKSFSRQPLDDWFLQIISEGTKEKWKR
jgi:molecular chaperone DnaK (HSP70)